MQVILYSRSLSYFVFFWIPHPSCIHSHMQHPSAYYCCIPPDCLGVVFCYLYWSHGCLPKIPRCTKTNSTEWTSCPFGWLETCYPQSALIITQNAHPPKNTAKVLTHSHFFPSSCFCGAVQPTHRLIEQARHVVGGNHKFLPTQGLLRRVFIRESEWMTLNNTTNLKNFPRSLQTLSPFTIVNILNMFKPFRYL